MDFFGMGFGEILLILVIAVILWGPGRIVEIARTAGKIMYNLKKTTSDFTTTITKELEIEDILDNDITKISGGELQRVAIARCLINSPKILLMDEPFGALDAQTRNMLQKELLDIWEATKKMIVFITHSVDEAVYLSDRIIVLNFGKKIATGTPDEIRRNPEVIKAYLGERRRDVKS